VSEDAADRFGMGDRGEQAKARFAGKRSTCPRGHAATITVSASDLRRRRCGSAPAGTRSETRWFAGAAGRISSLEAALELLRLNQPLLEELLPTISRQDPALEKALRETIKLSTL
jgi:hypothetical protein